MKDAEINLIITSWAKISAAQDRAAEMFYNRLNEMDPRVGQLFLSKFKSKADMFMKPLGIMVASLSNFTTFYPMIQMLGDRHVSYGAMSKDYEVFRDALMWTIGQILGPDYTSEVREAWLHAYASMANVMGKQSGPNAPGLSSDPGKGIHTPK